MTKDEMPVGFAMALAMNPDALQKFATLSEEEKQAVIVGTHAVKSKEDMNRYVNDLVSNRNIDAQA